MELTLIIALLFTAAGLLTLWRPSFRYARVIGAVFLIAAAFNWARYFGLLAY